MVLQSYAQNGEDVVLHRALKDVDQGHYIDIGAHHPMIDSVTKIFYDRGWSGMNVEASKESFKLLAASRPRDHNLHAAVAAQTGVLRFHEVSGTGLSTLDPVTAADAEQQGYSVEVVDVPTVTLSDICRNLPFNTTHFLKIDVEGGELGVLRGADFTSFRPWIVVVEATKPNTTERADGAWRSLLESAGYECVLFDGLNLFFLAREHPELRERLSAPANILDDFVATPLRDARAQLEELQAGNVALAGRQDDAVVGAGRKLSLVAARHEADHARAADERAALVARHAAEMGALWRKAESLTEELDAVRADAAYRIGELELGRTEAEALARALRDSSSWRITRPFRALRHVLHGRISLATAASLLRARGSIRYAGVPSLPAPKPPSQVPLENIDGLVRLVLRTLLRRDPDEDACVAFRESIERGTTAVAFIESVTDSEEFKFLDAQIERHLNAPQSASSPTPEPTVTGAMDDAARLLETRLIEKGCRIQLGAARRAAAVDAASHRRMRNLIVTLSLIDRL